MQSKKPKSNEGRPKHYRIQDSCQNCVWSLHVHAESEFGMFYCRKDRVKIPRQAQGVPIEEWEEFRKMSSKKHMKLMNLRLDWELRHEVDPSGICPEFKKGIGNDN